MEKVLDSLDSAVADVTSGANLVRAASGSVGFRRLLIEALLKGGAHDLEVISNPGRMIKGIGRAMDLVHHAKRVIVLVDPAAKDRSFTMVNQSRCRAPARFG